MRTLPILYQDDHLVAINKPAGLLVHKSSIDRREKEFAMQILRDQLGRWVYPTHRLDKATSGVLLFALDNETARSMMRLFVEGGISKTYLAVVRGFTQETELIDHPLKDEWDDRLDPRTDRDKAARDARTEYRRLATVELPFPVGRYETARYSLISVEPRTGRTHQIRRHMKHIFHPVIGDTTWGDGKQNEFFRETYNCRRMLLHCRVMSFPHPVTGATITIPAGLDGEFTTVLQAIGWGEVQPA
ncbi:MAG: pseudouridine synthase [Nitrospiraceae bacterium]|nr:pseudouridine synthase [Nitrospiraceae bacterium]